MLYDADDVMLFRVVLEKVKHCQSVAETTVDVTQPPSRPIPVDEWLLGDHMLHFLM